MKRTIIGLLVAAALLFLLGRGRVTASQEGGPSPTTDEAAQLAERVKVLESELKALTDKYEQSAGFSDTEYVLRIQRHYEGYYEKVLNTQTNMMWAVGILLTVLLGVASLFSFRQFDRQIDSTSRRVAAEQRVKFERRLEADLKILERRNRGRVSEAIGDLTNKTDIALANLRLRSAWNLEHSEGLIFASLKNYKKSVESFRNALKIYLSGKERGVMSKGQAATALANLFRTVRISDAQKFEDIAKKELQSDFYQQLKEELVQAAGLFRELAPLVADDEKATISEAKP